METETLKCQKRDARGKGAAKKLRSQGLIPCVVYGHGEEAQIITVSTLDLEAALRHGEHVLKISIDNAEPKPVFVKEVQYEVLTDDVLHVDFTIIRMDEKIEVDVPVVLRGTAEGTKAGGMAEQVLHEITVSCFPDKIPEQVLIDITNLKVGESIHVKDLPKPEGVDYVNEADELVISCHMPKGEEEEEAIPEEAAEPVRVGDDEKDEEEETEEAAAPEPKAKEKEKK